MDWLLNQLEQRTPGGYAPGHSVASEPTAWAAMALASAGRSESADRAAAWLAKQQRRSGAVPVADGDDGPHWTTSLSVLAWHQADSVRYASNIQRAVEWLLATKGKTSPRSQQIGHNTMLVGWSWADATHSWLEPTAFATMALTAAGYGDHPRTREAVAMLVDRLLPDGGCNYGNTVVLGQTLLPHLQPSGIVAWALAGQSLNDPRIEASLDYLSAEVRNPTGAASLAYGICGLTAWSRRPENADELIAEAVQRSTLRQSYYKLALLALASREVLPSTLPNRQSVTSL